MDMVDLVKMGASVFMNSSKSGDAGSGLDINSLASALSGLTGNNADGGLDIGAIIGKLTSGDSNIMEIAQSWLGDGDNQAISADNLTQMIGEDKITDFASKLGLSQEEAVGGLQDAIPQMVDKASSGGSLLDSIGGISGAINLASKLFGR